MESLDYSERLVFLKLHSLQRRRERYCIIYVWKIIEGLVPNFSNPIVCLSQIVDLALYHYHMYILTAWEHLPIIVSEGERIASSMLCLKT